MGQILYMQIDSGFKQIQTQSSRVRSRLDSCHDPLRLQPYAQSIEIQVQVDKWERVREPWSSQTSPLIGGSTLV